jgi:hypothetical protein
MLSIAYIILFLAFCGSTLEYGLHLPAIINWLTEPLIYLFLLISIVHAKRIYIPYAPLLIMFGVVTLASVAFNGKFNLEPLFSLRLVARFFLFFIALVAYNPSEKQIRRLNYFVLGLILLQLPVATGKFFVMGITENTTGTYSVSGGAASTMFPLIVIGYLIAFFLYYKQDYKFILLVFAFIYLSLIGAKRAVPFMTPVVLFFSMFIFVKDKKVNPDLKRCLVPKIAVIVLVITFLTGTVALSMLGSLNPEGKRWGSIDPVYAIKYLFEYETTTHVEWGTTGGRWGTTMHVFRVLIDKGMARFMFGYGPGAIVESRFSSGRSDYTLFKDIRFHYGVTGLNMLAMEYGIAGMLIYLAFLLMLLVKCIRLWRIEKDPFWKAYAQGSIVMMFCMLMFWSYYNRATVIGDFLPAFFYYLIALVFIRYRRIMTSPVSTPVQAGLPSFHQSPARS